MLLLFLDTETSGLEPYKSQIIELGGIIYELDEKTLKLKEIDSFSNLLKLRREFDDKITRITKITKEDLMSATSQTKVQTDWESWLSKYEITAIIGHSIDFDLRFLKFEGWFLPPETEIIDTLNLVRILFPELPAINLEFLSKTLKLSPTHLQKHHRSISDCYLTAELFVKILKDLTYNNYDNQFIEYLQKQFLPLKILIYPKTLQSLPKTQKDYKITTLDQKINILKENVYQDWYQEFNFWLQNLNLEKTVDWLKIEFSKDYIAVSGQIYVACHKKQQNPDLNLKFHQISFKDKYLLQLFLDFSSQKLENENQKTILESPESIIWQVNKLLDKQINFQDLVENLELFLSCYQQFLPQNLVLEKQIKQFLSSLDFFIFSINPFLKHWEYIYNPRNLPMSEHFLQSKLENIQTNLKTLSKELENLMINDELLKTLKNKILALILDNKFDIETRFIVKLIKNYLCFVIPKNDFSLKEYLQTFENDYPNLEVKTKLDADNYQLLEKLLGIELVKPKKYTNQEQFPILSNLNLLNFYSDLILKSEELQKPIVVFGGLNSSINDSQRILVENFTTDKYLLVGENGSFTKIHSKLTSGFVGLVVVKNGFSLENIDFAEIYLLNFPYFYTHSFWFDRARQSKDSDNYLKTLKSLFLQIKIQEIYEKYNLIPTFIHSYIK
jgi:DNA polymerase III epsilon subunit-like protein